MESLNGTSTFSSSLDGEVLSLDFSPVMTDWAENLVSLFVVLYGVLLNITLLRLGVLFAACYCYKAAALSAISLWALHLQSSPALGFA